MRSFSGHSDASTRNPGTRRTSYASVGYYFDLAALKPGERVVEPGSDSGMDSFVAVLEVGPSGQVLGIDAWHIASDQIACPA